MKKTIIALMSACTLFYTLAVFTGCQDPQNVDSDSETEEYVENGEYPFVYNDDGYGIYIFNADALSGVWYFDTPINYTGFTKSYNETTEDYDEIYTDVKNAKCYLDFSNFYFKAYSHKDYKGEIYTEGSEIAVCDYSNGDITQEYWTRVKGADNNSFSAIFSLLNYGDRFDDDDLKPIVKFTYKIEGNKIYFSDFFGNKNVTATRYTEIQ